PPLHSFPTRRSSDLLVVAPDPDAAGLRLAGLAAHAPVVDLHQIRQVVARPAAGRNAALASAVDTIGEADLQNRLLRLVRRLHDSDRKSTRLNSSHQI